MLYIKSENKTLEIMVEGTGMEVTNDVINAMMGLVKNFEKDGGEGAGLAFAATVMTALDRILTSRQGYTSMKEAAEEMIGVAGPGIAAEESAGVKA